MWLALELVLITAAVYATAQLVPGITFEAGWTTVVMVSLIWAFFAVLIRPVLKLLTLPISFLSLGLSTVLLNVAAFYFITMLVPEFQIENVASLVLGALMLSFLTWGIQKVT